MSSLVLIGSGEGVPDVPEVLDDPSKTFDTKSSPNINSEA